MLALGVSSRLRQVSCSVITDKSAWNSVRQMREAEHSSAAWEAARPPWSYIENTGSGRIGGCPIQSPLQDWPRHFSAALFECRPHRGHWNCLEVPDPDGPDFVPS
jgi:hypothetical protein